MQLVELLVSGKYSYHSWHNNYSLGNSYYWHQYLCGSIFNFDETKRNSHDCCEPTRELRNSRSKRKGLPKLVALFLLISHILRLFIHLNRFFFICFLFVETISKRKIELSYPPLHRSI